MDPITTITMGPSISTVPRFTVEFTVRAIPGLTLTGTTSSTEASRTEASATMNSATAAEATAAVGTGAEAVLLTVVDLHAEAQAHTGAEGAAATTTGNPHEQKK